MQEAKDGAKQSEQRTRGLGTSCSSRVIGNQLKSTGQEKNLSKMCCCSKDAGRPLSAEQMELIFSTPNEDRMLSSSASPVSAPDVTSNERSESKSGDSRLSVCTGVSAKHPRVPLPPGETHPEISAPAVAPSDVSPSRPSKPSVSTWRLKFNKFRSEILRGVSSFVANSSSSSPSSSPSTDDKSKAKFHIIDLSEDAAACRAEKNYSDYVKRCREGSTSDEDTAKESISRLFFMDAFALKNEATMIPSLWVGTSLGSVIVLSLEVPSPSGRCPVVVPTGTIFRLKGSVVDVSFLDANFSYVCLPPSVPWKDFEESAAAAGGGGGSRLKRREFGADILVGPMQHAVLTSERQIALVSLPSMTCVQRFKVVDGNDIVQAKVVFIRESACLLTCHRDGNVTVFDIPSIKPVQEFSRAFGKQQRLARFFCFSNLGHGMVMKYPTEIQKFVVTKGSKDELANLRRQLYVHREMPEPPKVGFFQSLFENQSQAKLDREALFGESGSGKASKTLAKQVSKMDGARAAAEGGVSEIAQARLAAIERGEKLGELEEKSAMLLMNAESFAQMSSQLENKYKSKKWYQF